MANLVNDDRSRLERVEDPFEPGIEFFDESEVWVPAWPVL